MSIKSWLLSPSAHTVDLDGLRWLAAEHDQHAEQTARERLAEWQQRAATEQAKARQLGRDYGRASRTIHALRAEAALLREGLRQRDLDLRDEHSVNNELAQALDERRPAPAPGWLGRELRRRWFAASDELTDDERWEQVAETAIDAVRGLWPSPGSKGPACQYCGAGCSDGRSWDGGDLYACPSCAERRASTPDLPTTAQAGDNTAAVDGEPPRWAGEPPRGGDCPPEGGDLRPPSGGQNPQTSSGGEDTSSPQPGPSPSGDTASDDVVCAFIHEAGCNGGECSCEPCCDRWPWCSSGTTEERHRSLIRTMEEIGGEPVSTIGRTPASDVVAKAERYGDEIGQRSRSDAIASAATTLAAHDWTGDDWSGNCRCGWPPKDGTQDTSWFVHVAEQLAAVGLLAIGGTAEGPTP